MLGVSDSVTDDGLEESLEDTTGLFVDHGGDTLDTTTASETTDRGLGDSLDIVAEDLAVTLGAAFAETFASFATCWGLVVVSYVCMYVRVGWVGMEAIPDWE